MCFRLNFAKDPIVINTASATVRQMVNCVYERVIQVASSAFVRLFNVFPTLFKSLVWNILFLSASNLRLPKRIQDN